MKLRSKSHATVGGKCTLNNRSIQLIYEMRSRSIKNCLTGISTVEGMHIPYKKSVADQGGGLEHINFKEISIVSTLIGPILV